MNHVQYLDKQNKDRIENKERKKAHLENMWRLYDDRRGNLRKIVAVEYIANVLSLDEDAELAVELIREFLK